MKRILALASGLLVLAHCGSFGEDSPTPATPPNEAGVTPVPGADGGGSSSGGPDAEPQPAVGYCEELRAKATVLGCADFDHDDYQLADLGTAQATVTKENAGIGREPMALQVSASGGQGSSTAHGGGRSLLHVMPPKVGQTLHLHLVFRIVDLTDSESGSSAQATLAAVELGNSQSIAFHAVNPDPNPGKFYVTLDETHKETTLRDFAPPHDLEMDLTVAGTLHDEITVKIAVDHQSNLLTKVEMSTATDWTVRLGAGFEGEPTEVGTVVLDDLSVELRGVP